MNPPPCTGKADLTPGPTREVPLNNYFLKTLFFGHLIAFSIKVKLLTWLVVPAQSHPASSQFQLALCLLSRSQLGGLTLKPLGSVHVTCRVPSKLPAPFTCVPHALPQSFAQIHFHLSSA